MLFLSVYHYINKKPPRQGKLDVGDLMSLEVKIELGEDGKQTFLTKESCEHIVGHCLGIVGRCWVVNIK